MSVAEGSDYGQFLSAWPSIPVGIEFLVCRVGREIAWLINISAELQSCIRNICAMPMENFSVPLTLRSKAEGTIIDVTICIHNFRRIYSFACCSLRAGRPGKKPFDNVDPDLVFCNAK